MPPPELELQEILDLQAELYVGFSEKGFQDALAELEAIHGKAYRNYTEDHTKLFLTVQNKVLPKYGFQTGQAGVLQMLAAGSRFNDNEEFCTNRAVLNELIGMAPPIDEELEQIERQAQAPPRAAPKPASQQLLVTESLRWAPTLTTKHFQPPKNAKLEDLQATPGQYGQYALQLADDETFDDGLHER
mmetsp:Transcript_62589/g.117078  ORF Transcript_62589/g.117078 Transcript_62589/m.117078 type:complete len:188 (+) Transcript_62589:55-618(+)